MSKNSLGQSSMEFLALVSLSALVLAGLYGVMVSKQSEALAFENRQTAGKVAEHVSFQVDMALVQGDGYSRVFSVPETLAGFNYTVEVADGSSFISWGNSSVVMPSRYKGPELKLNTSKTNVYRIINVDGEVSLVEE